jgi:hypothetical protein
MTNLGPNPLDSEYTELTGPQTFLDEDMAVAGGCLVYAVSVPKEGASPVAGVVYRFAKADGSGYYPPLLLVEDERQLDKHARLVASAVRGAIRRARELETQFRKSAGFVHPDHKKGFKPNGQEG